MRYHQTDQTELLERLKSLQPYPPQYMERMAESSYLTALSSLTNLKIQPSVPYIAVDMAAAILSVPAIQFGQFGDNALFIATEFGDDREMQGYFILMPEQDSYEKILKALGIVN